MTQEHPITPPPELVQQWHMEATSGFRTSDGYRQDIATQAARWGADQELEACCEWLVDNDWHVPDGECIKALRAARRPKPKTLKERGREALQSIHNAVVMETGGRELDVLKEIVESLPD